MSRTWVRDRLRVLQAWWQSYDTVARDRWLAVAFTGLPAGALVGMLVFILLLGEGLVWAWHRGYLEWS